MRDGRGRGNLHTWAPRSEVASWASRSRLARAIGQASGWGLRWGLGMSDEAGGLLYWRVH